MFLLCKTFWASVTLCYAFFLFTLLNFERLWRLSRFFNNSKTQWTSYTIFFEGNWNYFSIYYEIQWNLLGSAYILNNLFGTSSVADILLANLIYASAFVVVWLGDLYLHIYTWVSQDQGCSYYWSSRYSSKLMIYCELSLTIRSPLYPPPQTRCHLSVNQISASCFKLPQI